MRNKEITYINVLNIKIKMKHLKQTDFTENFKKRTFMKATCDEVYSSNMSE